MTANRVLIVGGDSLIGGALANRFSALGRDVTVTTRRPETKHAAHLALDLLNPPNFWPAMPDADTWVICACATKARTIRVE